ncbi:L,D-transpeptidase family protein [Chryseolinea sp. T2]|uniref:L,D-transpeptidase family protein n=1 Tax=Chryseolinea sp. T2 TaxID=3129255 RepID=UPI003077959C
MNKRGNWLRGTVVLMTAGAVLSSCSHKVAPSASGTPAKQDSAMQAVSIPLKSLPLDTVISPLKSRIASVESNWRQEIVAKTASFYKIKGYQTTWFLDRGPSPLFYEAYNMLKEAAVHGLDPAAYLDSSLEQRIADLYKQEPNANSIVELDMAFTDRFLLFTTHVGEGRVISVANGKSVWRRLPGVVAKDVDFVTSAATAEDLRAAVKRVQPQNEQYARLQEALVFYRSVQQYDIDPVSIPSSIKPGERSVAIPLLRKKLQYLNGKFSTSQVSHNDSSAVVSGHAATTVAQEQDSLFYDSELVAAVQLFQKRHGLTADGVIGDRTLRYMNQKISDRVAQIAVNMDRLRWMPAIANDRYLLVNIPDYKLTVYEGATRAFDMRVIVGSSTTPTPIFNDQLNHIVFSPTWTVPTSIIKNEIIPNLRKDSTYYSEKNFVIYKQDVQIDPALENWKDPNINPYQLRVVQNPGTDNSLGSVKFMMPNNLSVYLHDTPSRRLFTKDYRALSHGCIRLHEPAKLAEYLLKDQQGWDATRILKAMSGSSPATIILKKRYPVYLTYQTAWVDDEGLLQFREDIYGHDKAQLKQLMVSKPVPVTSVAVSAAGM